MSKRKSNEATDDRLKRRRSEEDEDFDLSQNPDFDVNEVDLYLYSDVSWK